MNIKQYKLPSYKTFSYVVTIVYLLVALSFVLIVGSINGSPVMSTSQDIITTKQFKLYANPVTDNDTVSLLRLEIKNATVKYFEPSSNAVVVGVCDNGRPYTDSKICADIAKSIPFEKGDFLGELTLSMQSNVVAEIRSDEGNGYFGNNRVNEYKMDTIAINSMDVLPVTGEKNEVRENRSTTGELSGKCPNADIDNNKRFDYIDLSSFAANYGMKCTSYAESNGKCGNIDFNRDGLVDYMDLAVFVRRYHNVVASCEEEGPKPTGGAVTPTPTGSTTVTPSVSPTTNPPPAKKITSMECLVYEAIKALNKSQGGYNVSPEIVYAVLYGETKFWCDNSGKKICGGGDPNQVSTIVPFAGGDDGIGISQALSYVANNLYKKYSTHMYACVDAIGVNYKNAPSYSKDRSSSNPDFSRKRVGDSICLAGLMLSEQGRNIKFTEADRTNVSRSMIIAEYFTCPGPAWCARAENYRPMLSSLIQKDTMAKCAK